MSSITTQTPRGQLVVRRESIQVTAMVVDTAWRYTDEGGHQHYWEPKTNCYPTLKWVYDEPDIDEYTGEELTHGHYECPTCGERIRPGQKIETRSIPGSLVAYLDDQPISREEAEMIMAEQAESLVVDELNPDPGNPLTPGDKAASEILPLLAEVLAPEAREIARETIVAVVNRQAMGDTCEARDLLRTGCIVPTGKAGEEWARKVRGMG